MYQYLLKLIRLLLIANLCLLRFVLGEFHGSVDIQPPNLLTFRFDYHEVAIIVEDGQLCLRPDYLHLLQKLSGDLHLLRIDDFPIQFGYFYFQVTHLHTLLYFRHAAALLETIQRKQLFADFCIPFTNFFGQSVSHKNLMVMIGKLEDLAILDAG